MGHELQSNHYKQSHIIRETETSPVRNGEKLIKNFLLNFLFNSQPPENPPRVLVITSMPDLSFWQPHQTVAECLTLQAETGDVQTAATILICLGEKKDDIPIYKDAHENWLQSYVDLLHRHQLWNVATEIINLSWIPTISEMNHQSTTFHTNCGMCGKPLYESGSYCKTCKFEASRCSVCRTPCKGVFAWCQGKHFKQSISINADTFHNFFSMLSRWSYSSH